MNPEKERPLRVAAQPRQALIHDHVAGTLHGVEIRFVQTAEVKLVVVEVKSAIEPKARVEHGCTDNAGRSVALLAKHCRQYRLVGTEAIAAEVVHTDSHRVGAREHHRMRRQGNRHRGVGLFKPHPVGCQTVDVRRVRLLIAIAAQAVGPQSINGNEEDIWRRLVGPSPGRKDREH